MVKSFPPFHLPETTKNPRKFSGEPTRKNQVTFLGGTLRSSRTLKLTARSSHPQKLVAETGFGESLGIPSGYIHAIEVTRGKTKHAHRGGDAPSEGRM